MKYLEQRIEELEKEMQEIKNHLDILPPYPSILGSWDPNPDYVDSDDLPIYYPPANPEDVLKETGKFTLNNQPIRIQRK